MLVRGRPGTYPLTSIAFANSSARLNDKINKGTNKEINCITLSLKFPSLISTPREDCAFNIFCVSSNKVGINLKAIEIINAISATGIPILPNGLNNDSKAKVKSDGRVVKVKRVEIITTIIYLTLV